MAQQVKAFAAKLDNLNWIPRIHTVEGSEFNKLTSDLHTCAVTHACLPCPNPTMHAK